MDESGVYESIPYRMKLKQSSTNDSFESLFREHWEMVNRLLRRMVIDPAEAEDLALETFYRLYKNQSLVKDGFNTRGWLYKVATNLALQSIRSYKRREQHEIDAGKYALAEAPETQPAELFAQHEEQRLASLTLANMHPRRAKLLILRHSGLSYKDIAETLGLSPTSIGPLLLRAEREFEKHYRALTQEEER
jgi:RNA polymerase sigma factor (sigma-70 family)